MCAMGAVFKVMCAMGAKEVKENLCGDGNDFIYLFVYKKKIKKNNNIFFAASMIE